MNKCTRPFHFAILMVIVGVVIVAGYSKDSYARRARKWHNARLIELGNEFAIKPQLAMDGPNSAMLLFSRYNGAAYDLWAKRFDDKSWFPAILIETLPESVWDYRIATSQGKAIAVWRQNDGEKRSDDIWASYFDGGIWHLSERINTSDRMVAEPRIAMDDDGNAFAVWVDRDTDQYNILTRKFDGTHWSTETRIGREIRTPRFFFTIAPEIAMESSGKAIVVWTYENGAGYGIRSNRFNGRNWGRAARLQEETRSVYFPQVAMDETGSAIAAWYRVDDIFAKRFDGVSWGETVALDGSITEVFYPRIAMDGSGNAMVVWEQDNYPDTNHLWARFFDGTSWGAAELLETSVPYTNRHQIAMDESHTAIAVWTQSDGECISIWANRFDGASWHGAKLIETKRMNAGYPQIAMDGWGNGVAVWQQFDGSDVNLWAAEYN